MTIGARRIPTFNVPRRTFNEIKTMAATSDAARRFLEHLVPPKRK
jgi:hypothetical protein